MEIFKPGYGFYMSPDEDFNTKYGLAPGSIVMIPAGYYPYIEIGTTGTQNVYVHDCLIDNSINEAVYLGYHIVGGIFIKGKVERVIIRNSGADGIQCRNGKYEVLTSGMHYILKGLVSYGVCFTTPYPFNCPATGNVGYIRHKSLKKTIYVRNNNSSGTTTSNCQSL